MERIFVDWGDKKPHTYLRDNGQEVHKTDRLDFKDATVYMEIGFPRMKTVGKLLEQGCDIYVVQGNAVADVRGDREKSDKVDVFYIRQLYRKEPEKFRQLPEQTQNYAQLQILAKKYNVLTSYAQKLRNKRQALKKQYGIDIFKGQIESIDTKKRVLKREVNSLLPEPYKDFMDSIDGIGEGVLLKIISQTDPNKYDSLTKFLYDNGYTDKVKENKELCAQTTQIRSIGRQIARSIIRHTDDRYYTFYKKLKNDGVDHSQACNRVATYVMKELYKTVSGKSNDDWVMVENVIRTNTPDDKQG